MASSAFAAEKPKVLMLFSYLGDQSYVRQYNVAKGRAAKIQDVQIDVKSGTSRGDVNFFIQERVAELGRVVAASPARREGRRRIGERLIRWA
jgi:hypothetical protein